MFEKLVGKTMEVYVDEMLVKNIKEEDHLAYLAKCFEVVREYGMKLNPTKCTLSVKGGNFLRYLVTNEGLRPI